MGTSEPTVIDDALSSQHKHYVEGDDDVGDGDDGDVMLIMGTSELAIQMMLSQVNIMSKVMMMMSGPDADWEDDDDNEDDYDDKDDYDDNKGLW